jgi:hypothetical protein
MNEAQFPETADIKQLADPAPCTGLPVWRAASFDTTPAPAQSLAEMRRMQDPSRFGKARFSFKLYKK